ncbi:MAG: ZIP family metal transporter [Halobacteriaceae archaeon]
MAALHWHAYVLVFVAGLVAAFGTSLGAVPLFFVEDIDDRVDVSLWGFAGGLMASASVFGILYEALVNVGDVVLTAGGFAAGILLVVVAHRIVHRMNYEPADMAQADATTMLNIFVVLLVHSFPEGIAIGVSFAHLRTDQGIHVLGFAIPVLAVVMTLALAIHNVPEGIATAIPMRGKMSNGEMWGAAFFTSIPQPIGAVAAFYFVVLAQEFLPFGYGLAAGAMLFLVAEDVLPEGLEAGESLDASAAKRFLAGGAALGFVAMAPLVLFL